MALYVALGGTALALESNSVKSRHILDGQVKSVDLAPGSVQGGPGGRIADGTIGAEDLDADAVIGGPGGDLADGSVTRHDVANQSLTGSDIEDNTVNADDVFGLGGADIVDDSLKGADVDEGTLRLPNHTYANSPGAEPPPSARCDQPGEVGSLALTTALALGNPYRSWLWYCGWVPTGAAASDPRWRLLSEEPVG